MKQLLPLVLYLIPFCLYSQQHRFRIMEYNVENLFDTLHTSNQNDTEFTPQGEKEWTSARYWNKLAKISKVIASCGETSPADLVALIEVESDSVVRHLTQRTKLWRLGYEYIITHSQDPRGINVALLYQPHRFRPLSKDTLRFTPPSKKFKLTRDLLHVSGLLTTGDTLDVLVCHLPSRKGGSRNEKYRRIITTAIKAYTDSVTHSRQSPYLILTGDFNAFYPEKNFTEQLQVALPHDSYEDRQLYLLSYNLKARYGIQGTYKYQGEWNQLDHFIVNGNLLKSQSKRNHPRTTSENCRIADFPFLLSKERNKDTWRPHRTYLGNYYSKGYSDHLPLILDLTY